ncbi:MAG: cytochrome-c oxidase, cbb3-type subunit III [Alphaproteobacteria bacterium]
MAGDLDRDALTGKPTTGHEWDGIRELNNPLPKWWLYVLYATMIWAAVYVVLYPAIPWFSGYSKGVLGWSMRGEFAERWAEGRAEQSQFQARIVAASMEEIRADPLLLNYALAGGRAAFADNCAPCHAPGGAGRKGGFPVLADDDWLWGGTLEAIELTIRHGVRGADAESRQSVMPAFGADGMLTQAQIAEVAAYVLTLSGGPADDSTIRGKAIFAEQCTACHGTDGKGVAELGGPNLADQIWLYGGARHEIAAQIAKPRVGVMPGWQGRLDPATIKMLAVYVHALGGGK